MCSTLILNLTVHLSRPSIFGNKEEQVSVGSVAAKYFDEIDGTLAISCQIDLMFNMAQVLLHK